MAVQVAKRFGAGQVIAAGRDESRLAELPRPRRRRTCTFERARRKAADVDVVIDYVWGEPTARAMVDLLTARARPRPPLTWIQIGSVAGPTRRSRPRPCAPPGCRSSAAASGRSPAATSSRNCPSSPTAVAKGTFEVKARAVPLADVEQAWTSTLGTDERIVLVP